MSKTFNIGDLVEILYVGQSSSYFPWTDNAVPGIYLGEMEFTHYKSPNEKKTDFCHKVWGVHHFMKKNMIQGHGRIFPISRNAFWPL